MKRKIIGFFVAMGVMIAFAVVALAGIITFYAKAASQTVSLALTATGVGGVIIAFAVMACLIPRNKDLEKTEKTDKDKGEAPADAPADGNKE